MKIWILNVLLLCAMFSCKCRIETESDMYRCLFDSLTSDIFEYHTYVGGEEKKYFILYDTLIPFSYLLDDRNLKLVKSENSNNTYEIILNGLEKKTEKITFNKDELIISKYFNNIVWESDYSVKQTNHKFHVNNEVYGILVLSRIAFNENKTKGYFFYKYICGDLCSFFNMVTIEKRKSDWNIISVLNIYVS